MSTSTETIEQLANREYKYGFYTDVEAETIPKGLNEEIHIAVMGCEVNGPGEARAADIGVAGGRGIGLIFKNGDVIRKVPEKEIVQAMREEVDKFIAERKAAKTAAVEAQ